MLRHTTRSLAGLSLRNARYMSASAPLRAPEVEESNATSAREINIPPSIVKTNIDLVGEGSHGQTSTQASTSVKWHKANELFEWDWFRDPLNDRAAQPSELALKLHRIRNRKDPFDTAWLNQHHELARTFRIARARLWTPAGVTLTEEEIEVAANLRLKGLQDVLREATSHLAVLLNPSEDKQPTNADILSEVRKLNAVARHTADKISAFSWAGRERAVDDLYKEHWIKLTDAQRRDEMLRVRYECARRVGWRKGYTSGYPKAPPKDEATYIERRELLDGLGSKKGSEVTVAVGKLAEVEEAAAWEAWISMDKATRREEEKAAWDLRDRSLIYTDDSAHILDQPESRWYSQPQKVGSMVFLPNVIVRLVRNTKTRHGGYDAFKATFRVPLSMHKHGLRSYLLAIYGLRTTWCRSAIYRAPIVRDRVSRQKRVGPANRTFKKVEVGLLEPFLFPEITPLFKQDQMRANEMRTLSAKAAFKVYGVRRWRGKIPVKSIKAGGNTPMLEDDDKYTPIYSDGMLITTPKRKDLPKVEPAKRILVTGGIVTKKRSRILRMIHKKTLAQEKEVAARVRQLKQEQREVTV